MYLKSKKSLEKYTRTNITGIFRILHMKCLYF